jgi:hypothetical protein
MGPGSAKRHSAVASRRIASGARDCGTATQTCETRARAANRISSSGLGRGKYQAASHVRPGRAAGCHIYTFLGLAADGALDRPMISLWDRRKILLYLINEKHRNLRVAAFSRLRRGKNRVPFVQHAPENSSENLWAGRFFIAWEVGFDNVCRRRRGDFPGSPRLGRPKGDNS